MHFLTHCAALTMRVGNPARVAELVVVTAAVATFTAAMVWTGWIIVIFRRDVKRARGGLCMHCGYDLSHSHGVCPECGRPIRR